MHLTLRGLAVGAILALSVATTATAKIWYVTPTGSGSGDSWGESRSDLGNLLRNDVSDGDEVWVATGVYTASDESSRFYIQTNDTKVYGGFEAGDTFAQRNPDTKPTTLTQSGLLTSVVIIQQAHPDRVENVVFDGFIVVGGDRQSATGGAGFYCQRADNVTVSHCRFLNNVADDLAAGAYVGNYVDGIVFEDCVFAGNSLDNAGATAAGVYIDRTEDVTLRGCRFENNTATGNGGGLYLDRTDSVLVEDCAFSANISGGSGGALYMTGVSNNTVVTGCEFAGNRSDVGDDNILGGGAIYMTQSDATIADCLMAGNTTTSRGGGLMAYNQCAFTLRDCELTSNVATRGGGLKISGAQDGCTVEDCLFNLNVANDSTPATNFQGGGGAYVHYASNPVFSNCRFIENTSLANGGGLIIYDPDSGNAGYLPRVTGCLFKDNVAQQAEDNFRGGGGAYLYSASVLFDGCEFEGNTSTANGGAMQLYRGDLASASSGDTIVRSCVFRGNATSASPDANRGGGAIGVRQSDATVEDSVFVGNVAYSRGGGLHLWQGGTVTVSGSTFANNWAVDGGGPLDLGDADNRGGAASIFESGALNLDRCVIAGNFTAGTASSAVGNRGTGGGLAAGGVSAITVSNSLIAGNYGFYGGGVLTEGSGQIECLNCTFVSNSATYGAHARRENSASNYLTVKNDIFVDANGAQCIRNMPTGEANFTLDTCVFFGNANDGDVTGNQTNRILADPKIVGGATGTWSAASAAYTRDGLTATDLTKGVADAEFTSGALAGEIIQPYIISRNNARRDLLAYVLYNTSDTVTVQGDWSGGAGQTYIISNYRLSDGTSPAVDTGLDLGLTSDLDGAARPFDFPAVGTSTHDIGAYELAPKLEAMPLSLDFGTTLVTALTALPPQTVTLESGGSMIIEFSSIGLAGGGAANFQQSSTTDDLDPGETREVTVAYAPVVAGAVSALLRIESNDPTTPTLDIPLTGAQHVNSAPTLSGDPIDLPTVEINDDYAALGVSLSTYANDANLGQGDVLTYTKTPGSYFGEGTDWLSIDSATGDLSGTPVAANAGESSWTITVTDLLGESVQGTIRIKVAGPGSSVRPWSRY